MRKVDFYKNHDEFETRIEWYGDFLARILAAKRVIKTKFEKLELVEAFMLKVAVSWEVLVEDDIIASINRDSSAYSSELGLRLRRHLTRDESEAILIGHRFLDFRSVGEVKSFAKRYLVDEYNPFKLIPRNIVSKIDQFIIIRNYLAHYSSSSMRAYNRMIKNCYNLNKIPEPGAFLIATSKRTGNYRWSDFLVAFLECSLRMRNINI